MKSEKQYLTESEKQLRKSAQNFAYKSLPAPWREYANIPAAGVFAGGWMNDSDFVMLSMDGFSIYNPITKVYETYFTKAYKDLMFANLKMDTLELVVPLHNHKINLFGIGGGNGIQINDSWYLELISPWWPHQIVVLYQSELSDWESVYCIELEICSATSWIRFGFAPCKNAFVILGEAGAEFYTRSILDNVPT